MLSVPTSRVTMTWTPRDYAAASGTADSGRIQQLADFCTWLLRDGRVGGTFEQRTSGMLALPGRFEPPELLPPGVADAWVRVFPEAEQARLLTWGAMLGIGFARPETDYRDGRFVRSIQTWDARWFDQDQCGAWWVTTDQGRRRVVPGDGWIVYAPYGEIEPWKHGICHRLAVPVLAKAYAIDDRSRSGEVTPLLVAETDGLSEPQRRRFLSDLEGLAQDSRIVLPEGCKLAVVDRGSGTSSAIHEDTIAWADGEIPVAIAGQRVTTEGSAGFSAGGAQKAILHAILRQQEATWSTCIGEQALTPWLRLAHGYTGPTAFQRWDVSDPEALASKAYAVRELAPQLAIMDQALAPRGKRVDAVALLELAGVPLLDLPAAPAAALEAPTPAAPPAGPTAAPPAATPPGAEAAPLGDAAALGPAPTNAGEREAFAAKLTELAVDRCLRHGRFTCSICGVARVLRAERGDDGTITEPIEWRALSIAGHVHPAPCARVLALSSAGASGSVSGSSPRPDAPALDRVIRYGDAIKLPRGPGVVSCGAPVFGVGLEMAGDPPDRVLVFRHGVNPTDKGDVILDPEGIAATIERMGTREVAFDLEHLSLNPNGPHYDPDARGYARRLEVDDVGLWAADVRWTEDGDSRIRSGAQRYTSPAVIVDDAGRMVGLVNIGLVAQPATREITPLLAAGAHTTMDDATALLMLRKLFQLKEDATNDDLVAKAVETATGTAPPKDKPEAPPAGDPAAAPPLGAAPAALSATADAGDDAATAAALRGTFGVASNGEALAALRGAKSSAEQVAAMSATVATLAADREKRERADIIAAAPRKFSPELIRWAETQSPAQLRAFSAVAPDLTSERLSAPPRDSAAAVVLTADDHAVARSMGISTADLAAHRAKGV